MSEEKTVKRVSEKFTDPITFIVEYERTTTLYEGDNLPQITTKSLRIRKSDGLWMPISGSIEDLVP